MENTEKKQQSPYGYERHEWSRDEFEAWLNTHR